MAHSEIWIHENLQGITARGVNYWESRDGKDRRLIFSIGDYLQEIDAADDRPGAANVVVVLSGEVDFTFCTFEGGAFVSKAGFGGKISGNKTRSNPGLVGISLAAEGH